MRKTNVVFIVDKQNKILLLRRAFDDFWCPGKWGPPGGIMEQGETPVNACTREAKEESNLDVMDLKVICEMQKEDAHLNREVHVTYFATKKYNGDVKISNEHSSYEWVSIEDFKNYDCIPLLLEIAEGPLSEFI